MRTLLAKRSKTYGDDVSIHTGRKPSGRIRDPIMGYLCYTGWLRITDIKLEPGEVKPFDVIEHKTIIEMTKP